MLRSRPHPAPSSARLQGLPRTELCGYGETDRELFGARGDRRAGPGRRRRSAATWTPARRAACTPPSWSRGWPPPSRRLGVTIHERHAGHRDPRRAAPSPRTARSAPPYVLRCTEGFTAEPQGPAAGTWLPMNSLDDRHRAAARPRVGRDRLGGRRDCSATWRTPTCTPSAPPTAGSRSAAAACRTASARAPTTTARTQRRTIERAHRPAAQPVPRRARRPGRPRLVAACSASRATGAPRVTLDRADGLGWAGGYVGSGVATTNLAGRTLRDLVLGPGHRR